MEQSNVQEMAYVIDEALRRIEELEHLLREERLRLPGRAEWTAEADSIQRST